MASGKPKSSPIIAAIADVENRTSAEIRVHLSRRFFERNPVARAQRLFRLFHGENRARQNAVLFYVNLRRRRFAIVADADLKSKIGAKYWQDFSALFQEDLQSTHPENAVALGVRTVGETLKRHFPRSQT